jgi:hypothetical protein
VEQFLPSCLGEQVAVIQAASLCHSCTASTAAPPARVFCILAFLSHLVMPSSHAPSNPGHSPCHMANAGSYVGSSFLSRFGDIMMVIATQSISALTRCMLPYIFHTRTSWMIRTESGLCVPHRKMTSHQCPTFRSDS